MRIDIMVDIETLGTTPQAPIIQLGAVAFNIETGKELSRFNQFSKLDKLALIESGTLRWWLQTNKELLTEILNNGKISENELLVEFTDWIYDQDGFDTMNLYLWGNGILFDNRIISEKCSKYDIDYPVYYRNDRDVRTIVELYCLKNNVDLSDLKKMREVNLVEHDALDDCLAQIGMVTICYRNLVGLEP